jgi:hypothetical protein
MASWSSVRERLLDRFFGDLVTARVQNAVKVVDNKWWAQVGGNAVSSDLSWSDRQSDLTDALDAWRHNPLARQIVRLTRAFVLQDGITFHAGNRSLQAWLDEFWTHRQNRMPQRLAQWSDALVLHGEVFPLLFVNEADGSCYVRSITARAIDEIKTKSGDLESEERYHQLTDDLEGKWWASPWSSQDAPPEMLHLAVNRPEGATRGSGDLDPILPWLRRYKQWLENIEITAQARRQYAWDLTVAGATDEKCRARANELARTVDAGGIYAHNETETLNLISSQISMGGTDPDGRALRMMVAVGAGISLGMLSEPEGTNRSTATEQNRGLLAHYRERQVALIGFVQEVLERAAFHAAKRGRIAVPKAGLRLEPVVQEMTKEDNLALAQAASAVVSALVTAKQNGWVDDVTAAGLMYKFAGEVVDVEKVLASAEAARSTTNNGRAIVTENGNGNGNGNKVSVTTY